MSSDDIQRKQNEVALLKVQYAAREYYNSAEKLNYYTWLFCLISAFSIFIPDNWPITACLGIPFVANLAAVCLMSCVNYKVKVAAKLRKYFEAYVVNILPNQFSESELRWIKEISGKTYLKNPQRAEIQMTHTERDSPPGVLDWFEFPKQCNDVESQFECQRQNISWNSKMRQKRLVVTICATVLVGSAFLLFMINDSILKTILCSAGLIIKIAERLIANDKYRNLSKQIEGAQLAVEACPAKESVEKLQNLIDELRSVNVLEINLIHERFASVFSKEYENTVL